MVPTTRIELVSQRYQHFALPLSYAGICFLFAAVIIVLMDSKDACFTRHSYHAPSTRFPTKKNSRIANATSVRVVPHLSNELTSLPACHSSQALPRRVLEGDERIKLPLQGS